MDKKYNISFWQDNEWAVYDRDSNSSEYVFRGTLEEVNAWISLKEKGFEL